MTNGHAQGTIADAERLKGHSEEKDTKSYNCDRDNTKEMKSKRGWQQIMWKCQEKSQRDWSTSYFFHINYTENNG